MTKTIAAIATMWAIVFIAAPAKASPTWEDQAFIVCPEMAGVIIEAEQEGTITRREAYNLISKCYATFK